MHYENRNTRAAAGGIGLMLALLLMLFGPVMIGFLVRIVFRLGDLGWQLGKALLG